MLKTHFSADTYEIGVDEVGRGPMFGRVYAGAVILPLPNSNSDFNFACLKDSKKFTSFKKLDTVAHYIMENAVAWGIGFKDERVIDDINILQATQAAMRDAIKTTLDNFRKTHVDMPNNAKIQKTPHLLVDGNCFKPMQNPDKPNVLMDFTTIVGGDNIYCSIAAASILAKWHRDKYIEQMCEQYPELVNRYQLNSNKGYGTKLHMDGIWEYGITQWHRRTFGLCVNAPVNKIVEKIVETD